MIASKDSFEPSSRDQLPNSTRVYVEGEQHKDIRVPMREIALNPTKSLNGDTEEGRRAMESLNIGNPENLNWATTQWNTLQILSLKHI